MARQQGGWGEGTSRGQERGERRGEGRVVRNSNSLFYHSRVLWMSTTQPFGPKSNFLDTNGWLHHIDSEISSLDRSLYKRPSWILGHTPKCYSSLNASLHFMLSLSMACFSFSQWMQVRVLTEFCHYWGRGMWNDKTKLRLRVKIDDVSFTSNNPLSGSPLTRNSLDT